MKKHTHTHKNEQNRYKLPIDIELYSNHKTNPSKKTICNEKNLDIVIKQLPIF